MLHVFVFASLQAQAEHLGEIWMAPDLQRNQLHVRVFTIPSAVLVRDSCPQCLSAFVAFFISLRQMPDRERAAEGTSLLHRLGQGCMETLKSQCICHMVLEGQAYFALHQSIRSSVPQPCCAHGTKHAPTSATMCRKFERHNHQSIIH